MANVTFDIFAKDHASSVLSKVGNNTEGLGSKLKGFGTAAATALAGATIAVAGLATAGVAMGLKTASALQQAQISFETLLGSADKSRKFLADLSAFAAKTPFELPGLISAARQLVGVGASAKSVIPTLTAWGDAAGALGISQDEFQRALLAVTQAMSKGKVQAEEMMQITEAGIPVWTLLAKATGKPVPVLQKLASDGKLLAKDVFPALEKQMEKDYGGSMAKQSQTLAGLWSTLMDTLNIGLAHTLQPLVPFLQKYMPGATKVLAGALVQLGMQVKTFMLFIGPAFATALKYVKGFFDGLRGAQAGGSSPLVTVINAGRTLSQVFQTMVPIIKGAVSTLLQMGQSILTGLSPAFSGLATLFTTVVLPIVKQVLSFIQGMVPVFSAVAAAVGGFLAAIMPKLQALGQQIVSVLGPGLKAIQKVIVGQVVPAFQGFMKALVPVANFILDIVGPMVISTLKGVIQFVKGAFQVIAGLLNAFSALFRGDWSALWKAVKQIGSGLWEAIKGAFKVFINVGLGKVFSLGSKLITGIGKAMWELLGRLFSSGISKSKGLVSSGTNAIVGFFKALPGRALSAVTSLLSKFGTFIANVFKAGVRGVTTGIGNMVKLLKGLPGKIVSAVGNLSRVLFNAGKSIIRGLINGITSMIGSLRKKLSSITNMLPDWKGPERVDIKILEPAGQDVMTGFMNGIERSIPAIRSMLLGVTQGIAATGQRLSISDAKRGVLTAPMSATAPAGGVTVQLIVNGPVGSQQELKNWLVKSLNELSRQGRVNPVVVGRG